MTLASVPLKKLATSSLVLLAPIALAVVVPPGAARAATIQYSIAPSVLDLDQNPTAFSLPYFSSAQGNLNSVTLQVVGEAENTLKLENLKLRSGARFFAYSATGVLASVQGFNLADSLNRFVSRALDPFDGAIDFGGPSGSSDTANQALFRELTLTTSSDLVAFIGAGEFQGSFTSFSLFGGFGSNNVVLDNQGSVVAGLNLFYNYTPTAIPTPALLPGLLGLGLGILRKRKALTVDRADR